MGVITKRKIKEGEVVSNKMTKTVVVKVERLVQHQAYKKVVKRTKKFMAHDEEGQCKVGDKVRIIETRPLSKLKRWAVLEVIEKAK
ncbi:MAG: 30S ribosomal protein S17 [Candidatus Tectomicrobia bacterium]|uniref:Small ribosomal subunit protein uS17 n=1 Tax=Tectimicrobiota bacterium TaxID=2528274 RepID=A0A933GLL6_UNCTE|nr:30S ribosomal protein S17 [Candidatus Tectomicrobia bacterium]